MAAASLNEAYNVKIIEIATASRRVTGNVARLHESWICFLGGCKSTREKRQRPVLSGSGERTDVCGKEVLPHGALGPGYIKITGWLSNYESEQNGKEARIFGHPRRISDQGSGIGIFLTLDRISTEAI